MRAMLWPASRRVKIRRTIGPMLNISRVECSVQFRQPHLHHAAPTTASPAAVGCRRTPARTRRQQWHQSHEPCQRPPPAAQQPRDGRPIRGVVCSQRRRTRPRSRHDQQSHPRRRSAATHAMTVGLGSPRSRSARRTRTATAAPGHLPDGFPRCRYLSPAWCRAQPANRVRPTATVISTVPLSWPMCVRPVRRPPMTAHPTLITQSGVVDLYCDGTGQEAGRRAPRTGPSASRTGPNSRWDRWARSGWNRRVNRYWARCGRGCARYLMDATEWFGRHGGGRSASGLAAMDGVRPQRVRA